MPHVGSPVMSETLQTLASQGGTDNLASEPITTRSKYIQRSPSVGKRGRRVAMNIYAMPVETGGVRGKRKAPKKKKTGRDERKYARKTGRNNSYAYGMNAETSVLK